MNEKLSITLPADMIGIINSRVETGVYASSSDMVEKAMRIFLKDEEEHEDVMASIRAHVKASLEDPRPSLTRTQMRQAIDALFEKYKPE